MKTADEVKPYFDAWLESATNKATRPEPHTFEAGLAMGYLQALALVLDDAELKARAHKAIQGFGAGAIQ